MADVAPDVWRRLHPFQIELSYALGHHHGFLLQSSRAPAHTHPIAGLDPVVCAVEEATGLLLRVGRDWAEPRGRLPEVLIKGSIPVAKSPADAASQKIQEERIGPVLGTISDRRIEYPPPALHSGPSHRIGRPLISLPGHA